MKNDSNACNCAGLLLYTLYPEICIKLGSARHREPDSTLRSLMRKKAGPGKTPAGAPGGGRRKQDGGSDQRSEVKGIPTHATGSPHSDWSPSVREVRPSLLSDGRQRRESPFGIFEDRWRGGCPTKEVTRVAAPLRLFCCRGKNIHPQILK